MGFACLKLHCDFSPSGLYLVALLLFFLKILLRAKILSQKIIKCNFLNNYFSYVSKVLFLTRLILKLGPRTYIMHKTYVYFMISAWSKTGN